jgi:CRP-like cAMP-binding protein
MQDRLDQLQSPEERYSVLRQVRELAELPVDDLRLVAVVSTAHLYPRGTTLWHAEDVAQDMIVIVEGAAMPGLAAATRIPKGALVGSVPLWAWDGSSGAPPRRSGALTVTADALVLRMPYSVVRPLMGKLDGQMARLFARHLTDAAVDTAYR